MYHAARYAVPLMKEKGGSIVITSSINGTRTFLNTGATAYSASKAGQVGFSPPLPVGLLTNTPGSGRHDEDAGSGAGAVQD
jgi:NADP-dependent 3-hydroxy acid dehydrogenase YdfG